MKPANPLLPIAANRPTYAELVARVNEIFSSEVVRQSIKTVQEKEVQLLEITASNRLIEEAIESLIDEEDGADPLRITVEDVDTFFYYRALSLDLTISEAKQVDQSDNARSQIAKLVLKLREAGIVLP